MDNLYKPKYTKSKLVTICNTDHDGFGSHFPNFHYKSESRSERSSTRVSFPSYRENLMFVEHFAMDVKAVSPFRLSFVYLGGRENGEVNYPFQQYESVSTVDISEEFSSVNSIFQVVSQLPKCRELRIYLSEKNIRPAKEEPALVDQTLKIKDMLPPFLTKSVKALKITQVGDIDPNVWNENESRLEYILSYAFNAFPCLESFVVVGLTGLGKIYDLIDKFCKNKLNLPIHNVALTEGKTTCQPVTTVHHQPQHQVSNNVNIRNPFVAPVNLQLGNPFLTNVTNPNQNQIPSRCAPVVEPFNTRDPRINALKRKSESNLFDIKKDIVHKQVSDTTLAEVVEVPVPPKPEPLVVNLSDGEEGGNSPPKKVKVERLLSPGYELPSPPGSTISKASTVTCSSMNAPLDRSNSLASIGSSYNDWETSSSGGEDSPKNSPNKVLKSDPMADFAANNSIDTLLNILNTAKSGSSGSSKKKRSSNSRGLYANLEGSLFDRPAR